MTKMILGAVLAMCLVPAAAYADKECPKKCGEDSKSCMKDAKTKEDKAACKTKLKECKAACKANDKKEEKK